jgi:hypothetical protein
MMWHEEREIKIHQKPSTHLLDGIKVIFHAFDSNILAGFNALRFQHFRESTFTLFAY